jgi:hypothetical protein
MLMRADVAELWQLRDHNVAIQVCKHEYTPRSSLKFFNQIQTSYPKKNWSSLMLINCARCTQLTPDFVNTAPGLDLHQFKWVEDHLVGDIPLEWNWLVGEYEWKKDVKNIHFTEGGPYLASYQDCDYADDWFEYFKEMSEINMA